MMLYKFFGIITFTLMLYTSPVLSKEECDCIDGNQCDEVRYAARRHIPIRYCDDEKRSVWCNCKETRHISEKVCMGYTNITDFCPHIPLIRNGAPTIKHEFPFMAKIEKKAINSSEYITICGGALIDPKYVLSAAHCFADKDTEYFAVLGAHEITDAEKRIKVKVTIHPNYGRKSNIFTQEDDIAVLELADEVDIRSRKKRPACLAYDDEDYKNLLVAGWGAYNDTNVSVELLKSKFDSVNQCDANIYNNDKQICVKPKQGFGSTCLGDSGGPLFRGYHDRENCLIEVVGIVSESITQCESEDPLLVYTKVYYYREWIANMLWPEEK